MIDCPLQCAYALEPEKLTDRPSLLYVMLKVVQASPSLESGMRGGGVAAVDNLCWKFWWRVEPHLNVQQLGLKFSTRAPGRNFVLGPGSAAGPEGCRWGF